MASFADSFFKTIVENSVEIFFPVVMNKVLSTIKNPDSQKAKVLIPLAVSFANSVIARFPEKFSQCS